MRRYEWGMDAIFSQGDFGNIPKLFSLSFCCNSTRGVVTASMWLINLTSGLTSWTMNQDSLLSLRMLSLTSTWNSSCGMSLPGPWWLGLCAYLVGDLFSGCLVWSPSFEMVYWKNRHEWTRCYLVALTQWPNYGWPSFWDGDDRGWTISPLSCRLASIHWETCWRWGAVTQWEQLRTVSVC